MCGSGTTLRKLFAASPRDIHQMNRKITGSPVIRRIEDTGALAAAVERNAVKREEARLYNRVRGVNENNE